MIAVEALQRGNLDYALRVISIIDVSARRGYLPSSCVHTVVCMLCLMVNFESQSSWKAMNRGLISNLMANTSMVSSGAVKEPKFLYTHQALRSLLSLLEDEEVVFAPDSQKVNCQREKKAYRRYPCF